MITSLLFVLLVLLQNAYATVTPDYNRGEAIVAHEVAGRNHEVCVIPKHYPQAKYSKKDLAKEKELCDWNIDTNVVGCAKDNSTNPGINFFTPPSGISIEKMISTNCEAKNASGEQGDKEAKYKISTSCSYSPSLLAYYHVSRILGGIGNIPPAVLRTIDLDRHLKIAEIGMRITSRGDNDLIYANWKTLYSRLKLGAKYERADQLFSDQYDQTYGALQWNPKNENLYKEFFNGGVDRAASFREKNPIYKALINPQMPVGKDFSQKNVQMMVQLRDASEMILIDTLLGQQDRFGNIHYILKYLYPEEVDGLTKIKSTSDKNEIPASAADKAVLVKEMILKDNDCGVAKDNLIKKAGLIDRVAHISPSTYKRFMRFESDLDNEETKRFFTKGFVFTERDYRTMRENAREIATRWKKACSEGRLKLDLGLEKHFFPRSDTESVSCE